MGSHVKICTSSSKVVRPRFKQFFPKVYQNCPKSKKNHEKNKCCPKTDYKYDSNSWHVLLYTGLMPGQFVATFIRAAAVKASVDPHVYFKQQLTGVVFLFASVLK